MVKTCILLVLIPFFGLIFCDQTALAITSIGMSLSTDEVSLDLIPNSLKTASQTITITTDNSAGYDINLQTKGKTNALVNSKDASQTIPTFVSPTNSINIPASALNTGYGYSTDGGANFSPMPYPSETATIFQTSSAGQTTYDLVFGAKLPSNIVAGNYTNIFTITATANPNSPIEEPEPDPDPCAAETICYHINADDAVGTTPTQTATSNTNITLIASDYSRSGYGFAGWNTKADGSGTNYGPNQTITVGDISDSGVKLYANWVKSVGDIQNWNNCNNLSIGELIALTDTRDGNTYAITKYIDGNCWIMENLRLNLSNTDVIINADNTNNPTSDFITAANAHPSSVNVFCSSSSTTCIDVIYFNNNNTNRALSASHSRNNASTSWHSYGNYYNWYTATAGNGTYSMSDGIAAGDICPSGWHLPTDHTSDGDLATLDRAIGGTGADQSNDKASNRWRSYPLNFVYSGEWRNKTAQNRNYSGSYVTSNTTSQERAINFWLRPTTININSNTNYKNRGQTVRCVIKNDHFATSGSIHYVNNGGVGTMADKEDVDFTTEIAANNEFTRDNYTFANWNTNADGTGITVLEGGSISAAANGLGIAPGGTLTLYAIWHKNYTVIYDGNNASAGSMSLATHQFSDALDSKIDLIASNFSRSGYGFIGWSTDPNAATKLANNQTPLIYGPNETIIINDTFTASADSSHVITLYATWLPADSAHTLQTFGSNECAALSTGNVLALTDIRDNNTYAISKLQDGNCWMIENLRLDPSTATISSTNTNAPTDGFIANAPSSSSSNTLCATDDSACTDQISFNANNLNRNLAAAYNVDNSSTSWYSYGVMYNWYTATAGNGTYTTVDNVAGDICPAGWRLPTGNTNGEFQSLNTTANSGILNSDAKLRAFPNNFVHSGDYNKDKPGGHHTYSRYWSRTAQNENTAFRFGLSFTQPTPAGAYNKWDAFTVRCITAS